MSPGARTAAYLYAVEGPTGMLYIGITAKTVRARWGQHCRDAIRDSGRSTKSYLHRAIAKHGGSAFKVRTLAVLASMNEARSAEVRAIRVFGTRAPAGYNLATGGEGAPGVTHSTEWCDRMRKLHAGKKRPPETVQRMKRAHAERTPEQRAVIANKIAAANAARSIEERERISRAISESKKGKPRDPRTVAKVATALKGRARPADVMAALHAKNRGRKHSPEAIERMRAAARARVTRQRTEA